MIFFKFWELQEKEKILKDENEKNFPHVSFMKNQIVPFFIQKSQREEKNSRIFKVHNDGKICLAFKNRSEKKVGENEWNTKAAYGGKERLLSNWMVDVKHDVVRGDEKSSSERY